MSKKSKRPFGLIDAEEWDKAMSLWHNLPMPQFHLLRQAAVQKIIDSGAGEVGSSDVNYAVFDLVTSGQYKEIINAD